MKAEIQWLVHLGCDRGLFGLAPCLEVTEELGTDCEIVPFAEALLARRACGDFDAMQCLVEEAWDRAQESPPPVDPLAREPHSTTEGAEPPAAAVETGEPEIGGRDIPPPPDLPTPEELENTEAGEEARTLMRRLLQACAAMGASDLHLSARARPFVRLNREVRFLHESELGPTAATLLNTALLNDSQTAEFERDQDLDFALALDDGKRYRANLFAHKDGISGTYRIVPNQVPRLEEVGFDDLEPIRRLLSYNNGLILVTGPVGSGKTVTLAAMTDELNRTRRDHLIAVEEPIEIVQRSGTCHITQREVGRHTQSFASALKSALRQDPDIILIGEMRDLETIEMAISASETGHLVIGTLHTSDASNTLNRVLDVFPAAQQTQIRIMLSHALRGIICQNLVPAADGGMALAYELLICNTAVRSLIHDNKPEGLVNVMETGSAEGMRLMDKSILTLWEKDRITDGVALKSLRSKLKRHQLEELIKLQQPT